MFTSWDANIIYVWAQFYFVYIYKQYMFGYLHQKDNIVYEYKHIQNKFDEFIHIKIYIQII